MSSARFPAWYGKYILLDRLNKGGMAEVFRAKTVGNVERLVAIKCMLETLADDEEFTTMFVDEAKLAAQLTHANIVQIFELGRMEDQLYIAMELVHGRDLRAVVKQANRRGLELPLSFAAYVMSRAADGLDYAHRKLSPDGKPLNIVHRDVSPQNILVGYDGQVKVVDFGIAKAERRATETRAGLLKGKFAYMAPEQVATSKVDGRTDIFALGSVLYECVAGRKLFGGDSDYSILERVSHVTLPTDPSAWERFTPALREIVEHATQREPKDRFQQAADLSEALSPLLIENRTIFGAKQAAELMGSLFAEDIEANTEALREFAAVTPEHCVSRATEEDDGEERRPRAATASRNDFSIVAREIDGVPAGRGHLPDARTVELGPRDEAPSDAATQLHASLAELVRPEPMGRAASKSGSRSAPRAGSGSGARRPSHDTASAAGTAEGSHPSGVTKNPTVRRITVEPLLGGPRARVALLGFSGAVALTLLGVLLVVLTRPPPEIDGALPAELLAVADPPAPASPVAAAPAAAPTLAPTAVPGASAAAPPTSVAVATPQASPRPEPAAAAKSPRPAPSRPRDDDDDDEHRRAGGFGYIAVSTESGGTARVYVDGKDVGTAPVMLKVKVGKRRVRVVETEANPPRAKMLEVTVKARHSRKEPLGVKIAL